MAEDRDILDYLTMIVPAVRDRRRPLENEWLMNHHAWAGKKTRFFYAGESDHFITAARRSVERFVTRCRKQLMPSQEFFEVYPWEETDPESKRQAEAVRAYLLFVLFRFVRVRSWLDQIIRSFLVYSRAVVKNTVRVVEMPRVVPNPQGGRPIQGTIRQVWPHSRVVDPFAWYFFPETATTLDEMQLIFEDTMMPVEEYKKHVATGAAKAIDYKLLGKPTWPTAHTVRLQSQGLVEPSAIRSDSIRSGSEFVALTEAWFKRVGEWQRAWIIWNLSKPTLARMDAHPFPEPSYRFAIARPMPGEGYTSGLMSDLEPLQVLLNDTVNLTQDAQHTVMSPPTLINPAAIFREDSLVHRPRAKWMVDPTGVLFPQLPDTTRNGWAGVQAVLGFMDSFSGSNPLAEGQPTRGLPRAGFAVSTLISLSMADISAVAELIEDEILSPTLSDMYRLAVVWTPPQQRLQLPAVMSLPSRNISVEELFGDWTFRWVGSIQSQDLQVKAQRMLAFLQILGKIAPLVMQSGKQIEWGELVQRLWREGIGTRGSSSIIRDLQPEEAVLSMLMQQGLAPPGGVGGGGGIPNPGTPEQAQRTDARNQTESQVGQLSMGLGQG